MHPMKGEQYRFRKHVSKSYKSLGNTDPENLYKIYMRLIILNILAMLGLLSMTSQLFHFVPLWAGISEPDSAPKLHKCSFGTRSKKVQRAEVPVICRGVP